jgi:hypothetical protein
VLGGKKLGAHRRRDYWTTPEWIGSLIGHVAILPRMWKAAQGLIFGSGAGCGRGADDDSRGQADAEGIKSEEITVPTPVSSDVPCSVAMPCAAGTLGPCRHMPGHGRSRGANPLPSCYLVLATRREDRCSIGALRSSRSWAGMFRRSSGRLMTA